MGSVRLRAWGVRGGPAINWPGRGALAESIVSLLGRGRFGLNMHNCWLFIGGGLWVGFGMVHLSGVLSWSERFVFPFSRIF